MKEENRKEILTREIIKKELKEVYLYNGLIHLSHLVVYILCFVILYILGETLFKEHIANFSEIASTMISLFNILMIIVLGVIISISIYGVYKFLGLLFAVCKDKFDIATDKLINLKKWDHINDRVMTEEVSDHKIRPVIYLFKKRIAASAYKYYYTFHFEKHKEYNLPEGKLYHWSQTNSMNDWQIYRSAEIGDEFYTVVINNKIIYVYNNKFFELKD